MNTKRVIAVIVIAILVTLVVLSSAAGDKPQELEGYSSLEVALGLLLITSVFWFPLALALLLMPRRRG